MRILSILFALSLFLSFGCEGTGGESAEEDPVSEDRVWEGLVYMGPEAQMFRVCTSGDLLWVVDQQNLLMAKYDSLMQPNTYYPVYAELRGSVRITETQDGELGSAEEKEMFMVSQIVKVQRQIPDDCEQYLEPVYEARGADSEWNLMINPYAKRASFVHNQGRDTSYYVFRPSVTENEQTIYRLGAGDTTLTVTITEEPCQVEGLREGDFTHAFTIEKGDQSYEGCGVMHMGAPKREEPAM